jgi:GH25 family lysozyme M1 (1,4-beta-N-acetylmuramidase)
MEKKGIDVSKWQGNIDWQKVKNDGIDFAIIRDGYGTSGLDQYFHKNIQNAQNAGISCGVYHYSYAKSTAEAKKEAAFCLNNIKNYRLEFPICFDIEDSSQKALGKQLLTDICFAFCGEIEKSEYYATIYCNVDWYKNYLLGGEISEKFDIWLAHWGVAAPSISCGIWQNSSNGKIDGINGDVDLDIGFKDYPQIMKNYGLNGWTKSTVVSPSTQAPPAESSQQTYQTYTVQKDDNLWNIAKKFLGDGTKYLEIKKINFLVSDTIYPGQILKMPTE